jgi:type II secretory pathway component GspD/PulD (secretin)
MKKIIINNKCFFVFCITYHLFIQERTLTQYKANIIDTETILSAYQKKSKIPDPVTSYKNFLEPWNRPEIQEQLLEENTNAILLNFVNANITDVLKYFEDTFKVIFITDDAIQPVSPFGKSLYNSKVNFSSHIPLSKQEAWNVLVTLLELVGVTLQPGSMNGVYRVVSMAKDSPLFYNRGVIPTFINVDENSLPNTDMRVRYVYQVKNGNLESIMNMIKTIQSPSSPDPIMIREMNAVLFVDRIFNIKIILKILQEIESMIMPEELKIINLKYVAASHIVDMYKNIIKDDAKNKHREHLSYFDPHLRLIPDFRNNAVILLGNRDSIEKMSNFISTYQDIKTKSNYQPFFKYQAKHSDAEALAQVLRQALGFKNDTEGGKNNAVIDNNKFLTDVFIVPDPNTNSLLISCSAEQYHHVYKILQKIDVEPTQVAVNIILLSIEDEEIKQFGTQLRNGKNANNINWQTGLLDQTVGVVGNYQNQNVADGASRLLGNLLNLVTGGFANAGNTIISLGSDPNYGVWGIVKMYVEFLNAKIINNPFIVMTNKSESSINVGETRRIASTSITNSNNEQQSYTSDEASLSIKMTSDIAISDNIDQHKVTMKLDISNSIFTAPEGNSVSAGNKVTRNINTSVTIKNNEIIAISGLFIETESQRENNVPWLSTLPFIGALFTNKQKTNKRSQLVILVVPSVIECDDSNGVDFVYDKIKESQESIAKNKIQCPLRKAFFKNDYKSIYDFQLTKESIKSLFMSSVANIAPSKDEYREKTHVVKSSPQGLQSNIKQKQRSCRRIKMCQGGANKRC